MDEEREAAMDMSKEELLARRDAGTPAKVVRKPRTDIAMTAKRMMDAVIQRTEEANVVRRDVKITPEMHIQRQTVVRVVHYEPSPVPTAAT